MTNQEHIARTMTIKAFIAGIIMIFLSILNVVLGATITSAQTGLFSEGTTWVGGAAPAPMDNIIIATGHTVTIDEAAASFGEVIVYNITIEEGAVLDNGAYNLKIQNTYVGNPVYTNNGIHNGTGNLITYDNYDTEITGSGTVNCNIEVPAYGLKMVAGCNLVVNADIMHSTPGNYGMSNKELIGCWTVDTHLTVNGNIISDPQYMVGITIVAGSSITVSGNVSLAGGLSTQSGSTITNAGTFTIGGDLTLGPFSGFCQNSGTMTIGGDLLGSGATDSYFLQEAGAKVSFGGSVFPDSNDGMLHTSGIGLISGASIEPNTVEYNGTIPQIIALPVEGHNYSLLEINNTNAAGVSLIADMSINGGITFTEGKLFLGGFNLILSDSASISGTPSASAMAVATGTGEFMKTFTTPGTFLFPVGDNDATPEYSPVSVEFTSGTFTDGVVGVKLTNTTFPGVKLTNSVYPEVKQISASHQADQSTKTLLNDANLTADEFTDDYGINSINTGDQTINTGDQAINTSSTDANKTAVGYSDDNRINTINPGDRTINPENQTTSPASQTTSPGNQTISTKDRSITNSTFNRFWSITSSGITDFNCEAQFHYVPADVIGIESDIWGARVAPDTLLFTPADTILHILSASALTAFGTFTGLEHLETALPLAYTVTGGGSYCAGGEGLPVGLSDSEPSVTYTLFKDGLPQQPTVAGTGDSISFGNQTAGTYTIDGTNTVGTVTMAGSAVIIENPLPEVIWTAFDPDTLCIDWEPVLLTGGTPEGGYYSGNGVTGSSFDPATAGAGVHEITYHYTDDNGCSNEASLSLFVDLCTGVKQQPARLTLYPNPATETITLNFNGYPLMRTVKLYNQTGRIAYQNDGPEAQSNSLIIPVGNYPAGQYLLVITGATETQVKKVLIVK